MKSTLFASPLVAVTGAALFATAVASAQCPPEFMFTDSEQILGDGSGGLMAVGDVDGDGDVDVVVPYRAVTFGDTPPNEIWLNAGNGTFYDSGQRLGDDSTYRAMLEDFNGDGHLDIYFMNSGISFPPPPNTIWMNDGTGTFTLGDQIQAFYSSVATGDVDGDGDVDLVIPGYDGPGKVMLNDGSGSFTDSGQPFFYPGSASVDIVLADFNGDTHLDAFVAQELNFRSIVLFNDGTGVFTASDQQLPDGNSGVVQAADIDSDGDIDVVVSNCCTDYQLGIGEPNSLWINDGNGNFSAGPPLGSNESYSVVMADLDLDGDVDVVESVINFYGESYHLPWLNDGNGNFTDCPQTIGPIGGGMNLTIGDLDGDGDPDAVFNGAPFYDPDVPTGPNTVWFNMDVTGACCVGTGCEILTGGQCANLGGQFLPELPCEQCPVPCLSDVTGDGQVSFEDVLVVISGWGACP